MIERTTISAGSIIVIEGPSISIEEMKALQICSEAHLIANEFEQSLGKVSNLCNNDVDELEEKIKELAEDLSIHVAAVNVENAKEAIRKVIAVSPALNDMESMSLQDMLESIKVEQIPTKLWEAGEVQPWKRVGRKGRKRMPWD